MSDILDLIDGALWEHGDAMRWTPPPGEDEQADIVEWMEANLIHPYQLTEWQAKVARLFQIPPDLLDGPETPPRGLIEMYRRLSRLHTEPPPVPVEPETDGHGRVPYFHLSEDERHALHQWCSDHHVDYKRVPIDGLIELDATVNEWRIETYRTRGGKHFLGQDGDIARTILRRAHRADLPWRRPCPE